MNEHKDKAGTIATQEYVSKVYSSEISLLVAAERQREENENQQLLRMLLRKTIEDFAGDKSQFRIRQIIEIYCGGLPVVFAATVGGIWIVSMLLSPVIGEMLDWLLIGLAISTLAFLSWYVKTSSGTTNISLRVDSETEQVTCIDLGRFTFDLCPDGITGGVIWIVFLIAMQAGLIRFTSSHLGVQSPVTMSGSILLSVDSFCRGAFLDIFELYDVSLIRSAEMSLAAAAMFFAFRIVTTTYFLMFVFGVYRWARVSRFLTSAGASNDVAGWLDKLNSVANRWAFQYVDEFVFLRILKAYLDGNFEEVSSLSKSYPCLCVTNDLRRLFVDNKGRILFAELQRSD
jgi:hypothetical protein